jgi:Maltokinase N-terminal cap domain
MAVLHDTTMSPGKLELLASWLPAQPWYLGAGRQPVLTRAGGFRLDDPQGEVGIEFMVVADDSGEQATFYLVPMTYRGHALASADGALIGTSDHGVLGPRWIYDGVHDPVLVAELVALIQGEAEPQAQSVSNTADPTVTSQPVTNGSLTAAGSVVAANGPSGTRLRVATASADGTRTAELLVQVNRVLQTDGDAGGGAAPADSAARPCLSATWRLPDGTRVRGVFATAQYA